MSSPEIGAAHAGHGALLREEIVWATPKHNRWHNRRPRAEGRLPVVSRPVHRFGHETRRDRPRRALAPNVAHGPGHGLPGAQVAAWPAVALVGSYELLMMIIRAGQLPGTGTALGGAPASMPDTDPLQVQAAQAFSVELAAGRVPSVRAIRARLHIGQPRAQRVRAYLAARDGAQACVSLQHRDPISEVRPAA